MSQPLLTVRNLRTAFATARGLVQAVDDVSFDLMPGRTLAIVGESGSGKSVLSRSIMGLLPRNAEASGQVCLHGRNLRALPERELRKVRGRDIAMVLQDPMTSLTPTMTIGKQIIETLVKHRGLSKSAARERALALLASVGMPQPAVRIDNYPHQLSGGMRQRVAIAIALSCEPSLIIADEPTTALDVTVQSEILDLLKRQVRERHMSMILITHDMGIVAGRADDVAVMYAGRIVEQASVRALFHQTRVPYTAALLASIPRMDGARVPLETIPGRPPDMVNRPTGCSFQPRCRHARPDCALKAPPLDDQGGHRAACWYPLPNSALQEAL
ncbi:ABC transporter ATP-binding protein [Pararhodobacter zhoushanensis]|uniref:ABC transporter ATP-binding protein n=1 Tax=Pararhodobacter zhoushanensis TaxID=2479545 RepID=UPI000F8E04FC|nr:ABC transporter ATP-binding protein [Pararhodobacter zhoushanensis]